MSNLRSSHVVVAIVALLIGGATTAVAAKMITSKQIKNGTIKLQDLSKSTQSALGGGPGQDGADGAPGANGSNGTPGASGAPGPALFLATMAYDSTGAGNTFSTPGAGNNTATENTSQAPVPAGGAFTAKGFTVSLTAAVPVGANSVEVALRNNGANILSCTVPAGASTCSSGAEVVVPSGASISMRTSSTNAAGDFFGTAGYSFRAEF